jgi:DNA-binding NarL/FixJ family response regulator
MVPLKKVCNFARTLKSQNPSVGIVILLETSTRESVIAAFRCGAAGVLSRTDSIFDLAHCIGHASHGEIGANKCHSDFLLAALRSTPSCEGIEAGKVDHLSPRELQVWLERPAPITRSQPSRPTPAPGALRPSPTLHSLLAKTRCK